MNIIIAVDGSRYSDWAVDLLLKLPLAEPPRVTIMHVVDLDPLTLHLISPPLARPYTIELRKRVDRSVTEAERYTARAADRIRRRWNDVRTVVETGFVANAIIAKAKAERADLIMLGARGLGEVKGVLLGSVSQKVAAYAPCSVLLVKKIVRRVNNVLVPVDGSRYSRGVVTSLRSYFLPDAIQPMILFVWEYPLRPPPRSVSALQENYQKMIVKAGFQGNTLVVFGRAAQRIVEIANGTNVDLVVVGSRGLTGVKRFWGSVSRKVTMDSPVSVLIVRR
jgi:nucleotide-binding universal stress UspA family protein